MMPDAPFGDGLVWPDYEGACITQIGPLVWRNFGLKGPEPAFQVLEGRRFSRVILLTLDAFGFETAQGAAEDIPDLRDLLRDGECHRLTSVYPSTTTVALTSLHGAAPPASHGLLGHELFVPALGGVANTLRYSPRGRSRREVYANQGFDSRELFPCTTIYQRLQEGEVPCYFISRAEFRDTGLGRLHHKGAEFVGYHHLADCAVRVAGCLEQSSSPVFISAYWDMVDRLSHLFGADTAEVYAAIDLAFHLLRRQLAKVPAAQRSDTLLLVTADHGHHTTPPEKAIWLRNHPDIRKELLFPPTGSARSGYLHALPGRVDALGKALAALADDIDVVPTPDAIDAGLWGAPEDARRHRASLGDFVFHCRAHRTLLPANKNPSKVRAISRHSGLTPEEMHVPLIAIPLEDWV